MRSSDGKAFRDGGMNYNNPAAIALHEAKCMWPNKPIDTLLSVGTGTPQLTHPRFLLHFTIVSSMSVGTTTVKPVAHPNTYSQLLSQIANACAETEKCGAASRIRVLCLTACA